MLIFTIFVEYKLIAIAVVVRFISFEEFQESGFRKGYPDSNPHNHVKINHMHFHRGWFY